MLLLAECFVFFRHKISETKSKVINAKKTKNVTCSLLYFSIYIIKNTLQLTVPKKPPANITNKKKEYEKN